MKNYYNAVLSIIFLSIQFQEMTAMNIRIAQEHELAWINENYKKVDFAPSQFGNELIVIAEVDDAKAGIGRLVYYPNNVVELGGIYIFDEWRGKGIARSIVTYLIGHIKNSEKAYCIPFESLAPFYISCGFQRAECSTDIPALIKEKLQFCEQTYSEKTVLLEFKRAINSDWFKQKALHDLLEVCSLLYEDSPQSIVAITQKHWLLPRNEKEPLEGSTYPPDKKDTILRLLDSLGYIKDISPKKRSYDYVIIFGGETETIVPRINYAASLIKEGLECKNIILQAGIQQQPTYDASYPLTEAETMRTLFKQSLLPTLIDSARAQFVDTPLKSNGQRPSARDGLLQWLIQNPKPGVCLFVSSQPYIQYYEEVIKHCLPPSFSYDVAGPAMNPSIPISEILDYVTRHLWQCMN